MDNFRKCDIILGENKNFKTIGMSEVQSLLDKINLCFENEQQNFCNICCYLYKLQQLFNSHDKSYYKRYFDKNGNYVFYETIFQNIGLEEKQVNRYISIYNRFINRDDVVPKMKDEFFGYSKSKLVELLPLSDNQIQTAFKNKSITDKTTVKEIRAYIKQLKSGQPQAKKVLEEETTEDIPDEEIPYAYDPNKYYDFDYFKSKNKNQLLNIVWELQRHFEKYLKK